MTTNERLDDVLEGFVGAKLLLHSVNDLGHISKGRIESASHQNLEVLECTDGPAQIIGVHRRIGGEYRR